MKLTGKVWKDGKWWLIECPALDGMTQGKSKDDALRMMKDWVWSMIGDDSLPIEIATRGKDEFVMSFAEPQKIVALMIHRARVVSGKTLQEVAADLGSKSHTAVRQYETGKHDPGFTKFQELLEALGCDFEIQIVEKKPRKRVA